MKQTKIIAACFKKDEQIRSSRDLDNFSEVIPATNWPEHCQPGSTTTQRTLIISAVLTLDGNMYRVHT